jgi:hypothetical protein
MNNMVEQDHRFMKRRIKPGLGFFSFPTAWRTIRGYEVMHMIRKGQIEGAEKGKYSSTEYVHCRAVWLSHVGWSHPIRFTLSVRILRKLFAAQPFSLASA